MKRDRSRPARRGIGNLSPERQRLFDKRFVAYALAAAGVAASAHPAAAEVVFTKTNLSLLGGFYPIDLNHDKKYDFELHAYLSAYYSSTYNDLLKVRGQAGASVIGQRKGNMLSAWDAPLSWSIGPNSPKGFVSVQTRSALMAEAGPRFNPPQGPWKNATNRYLGLKFLINGEVHYGWARLTVSTAHGVVNATLTGYAYETTPNMAILAGDRGPNANTEGASFEKAPAGPSPSLGLLSLGAAGLNVWRRETA